MSFSKYILKVLRYNLFIMKVYFFSIICYIFSYLMITQFPQKEQNLVKFTFRNYKKICYDHYF